MEPKTYRWGTQGMITPGESNGDIGGEWVRASEYRAMAARIATLEGECERLRTDNEKRARTLEQQAAAISELRGDSSVVAQSDGIRIRDLTRECERLRADLAGALGSIATFCTDCPTQAEKDALEADVARLRTEAEAGREAREAADRCDRGNHLSRIGGLANGSADFVRVVRLYAKTEAPDAR